MQNTSSSQSRIREEKIETYRNWFTQQQNIAAVRGDYEYRYIHDMTISTNEHETRSFQLEIYRSVSRVYRFLLFELIQTVEGPTLLLVMYRNVVCKKHETPYIIYDHDQNQKKGFYYEFYGTWLSVNPNYRRQDISLFSYYIYALIINNVEVIQNFTKYHQVVLVADDVSTIRTQTEHEKCAYCPFYSPAFYLYPSGEPTVDSRNTNQIYMRNPRKMQKLMGNTGHVRIGDDFYNFQDSRLHFFVPSIDGNLIDIVLAQYNLKKSKNVKTIGVLLIESCENERLGGILRRWGEGIDVKILDAFEPNEDESNDDGSGTALEKHTKKIKINHVESMMSNDMLFKLKLLFDLYVAEEKEDISLNITMKEKGVSQDILDITFKFTFVPVDFANSKRRRHSSSFQEDATFNRSPTEVTLLFRCSNTRYGAAKIKLRSITHSSSEKMIVSFYIAYTLCKSIVVRRMKLYNFFLISTFDFDKLLLSNINQELDAKSFIDNVVTKNEFENIIWWAPESSRGSDRMLNGLKKLQQGRHFDLRINGKPGLGLLIPN